jgi:hypothetical protein
VCNAGFSQSGSGSTLICSPCPVISHSAAGASTCTCDSGYGYKPSGSSSPESCLACDAGKYSWVSPVALSSCYTCPIPTGINHCGDFRVYCVDGYVLLAKIDGRKTNWLYGSSLWTDGSMTLNPQSLNLDQVDARLDAYKQISVSSLRVRFADIGASSYVSSLRPALDISLPSSSTLQSLMSAGTTVTASLSRAQWDAAVSGDPSILAAEPNCNYNGINVYKPYTAW